MKAVILPAYNKNVLRAMLSLRVEEVDIPKCEFDEVLVKTYAAVCNPSDIAFIQGVYNIVKPIPTTPGFEGSGEIVDAGEKAKHLIGKKVSAFVQGDSTGTWSEYFIAKDTDIIVIQEDMDMEQAACFTVNPFTAYAMFETVKFTDTRTIIQNASGSQLAAFIRKMADEIGVETIDIVRKDNTANFLKSEGARNVLIESEEEFEKKLEEVCLKLKPTVAFDAVGGHLSGIIYNNLAAHSDHIVYGGLSNKPISDLNVMGAIFHDKVLSGFNLIDWKNNLEEGEFEEISKQLQRKFINKDYITNIQTRIPLEEIISGLKSYLGNMSGGKLLIKP